MFLRKRTFYRRIDDIKQTIVENTHLLAKKMMMSMGGG